jgi:Cu+-exporting ATPase
MTLTPELISTVLHISGMRDNACRETVLKALEAIEGVLDVDVNLYRARATIAHRGACQRASLMRAVMRAGYEATLAENGVDRPSA